VVLPSPIQFVNAFWSPAISHACLLCLSERYQCPTTLSTDQGDGLGVLLLLYLLLNVLRTAVAWDQWHRAYRTISGNDRLPDQATDQLALITCNVLKAYDKGQVDTSGGYETTGNSSSLAGLVHCPGTDGTHLHLGSMAFNYGAS